MPLKQDPVSILKIKEYLMSISILNLHIMSYLLKVTGSCIITVLCNLRKLGIEEAWEAVYVEELWLVLAQPEPLAQNPVGDLLALLPLHQLPFRLEPK